MPMPVAEAFETGEKLGLEVLHEKSSLKQFTSDGFEKLNSNKLIVDDLDTKAKLFETTFEDYPFIEVDSDENFYNEKYFIMEPTRTFHEFDLIHHTQRILSKLSRLTVDDPINILYVQNHHISRNDSFFL